MAAYTFITFWQFRNSCSAGAAPGARRRTQAVTLWLLRHGGRTNTELDSWYEDLYDHILLAAEWTESLRDTIAGLRDDAAQPEPETCSAGQVCRYV